MTNKQLRSVNRPAPGQQSTRHRETTGRGCPCLRPVVLVDRSVASLFDITVEERLIMLSLPCATPHHARARTALLAGTENLL